MVQEVPLKRQPRPEANRQNSQPTPPNLPFDLLRRRFANLPDLNEVDGRMNILKASISGVIEASNEVLK